MQRILLFLAGTFILLVGTGITALSWEGYGSVKIQTAEINQAGWSLPLPMSLAHVAMAFAPKDELKDARTEVEGWITGLVAALDELENAPDGILIHVSSEEEMVRIEKRGGSLRIQVVSEEEQVEVTLPLRSLTSLARSFEEVDPHQV